MAHEYWLVEVILWIIAIVIIGLGSFGMYLIYRKDKAKFNLGVTLFFFLFMLCRICVLLLVYSYGYDGVDQYLFPYPTMLWLQIGYNVFGYAGVFFLYFVLERYVLNTKYIFSTLTVIIIIFSVINCFIPDNLFIYQTPFFLAVILGFPVMYIYLAAKNSGEVRKNSIIVALGAIIFELGYAFAIPNAQATVWSSIMAPVIYEFLGPILHIIGTITIYLGFSRHAN